jgi:Asp-tRNA(Asn)/Glu-tRNA(Gln) amidotransferase A subunit family amidase
MHRSTVRTVTAIASWLIVGTACDHTVDGAEQDVEELTTSAVEQAERAGRSVEVEMASFKRGADDALAEVDAKLQRAQQRAAEAGDNLKDDTAEQIEALKRQRDELAREIDQAATSADVEWQATKRSLDASIAKLGRDADELLDNLGDEVREATE